MSPLRWALVAGGFIGTLVILRPGGTVFSWAILLPLGLVVTNAWFQVLTSRLARTEKPLTMHFYSGWVGTLIATVALPFVWTSLPGWHWWALLCLMGFMATVGHFLLILAYQRAPASTLTPYLYAQIGFAMFGGWLMFQQVPDATSLVGIGLIAVCGAAGAWLTVRERKCRSSRPSRSRRGAAAWRRSAAADRPSAVASGRFGALFLFVLGIHVGGGLLADQRRFRGHRIDQPGELLAAQALIGIRPQTTRVPALSQPMRNGASGLSWKLRRISQSSVPRSVPSGRAPTGAISISVCASSAPARRGRPRRR